MGTLRVRKPLNILLTVSDHSSDKTNNSAVPDHVQRVLSTNEKAPGSTDENTSWTSTASAAAKLILRGVKESADAFGPLKAVAGGLCFILENCEVQPSSLHVIHHAHQNPANKRKQTSNRVPGTQGQAPF